MLLEMAALVIISFQVEEVEGLLAGTKDQWNGVAVPQCELQLHIDLLCRLARDPVGPKPVVLAVFHHIADLEGPDGSVVLIHSTDLFPLEKIETRKGRREKKRKTRKSNRQERHRTKYRKRGWGI